MVGHDRLGACAGPMPIGLDPYGGHAERAGRNQVARDILDHHSIARHEAEAAHHVVINCGIWFRDVSSRLDIVDRLEMLGDA